MPTSATFVGIPSAPPAPPPSGVCRITGTFRNMAGQALVGYRVRFSSDYTPVIHGGVGVQLPALDVGTNASGLLTVDLLQGMAVHVHLPDRHDLPLPITVPVVATADLFDLIYPYVVSVAFTPTTLALAVGEEGAAVATTTLSDTRTVVVTSKAAWVSDTPGVAAVSATGTVVAVAAGAAGVSATLDPADVEEVLDPTTGAPWAREPAPTITYGTPIAVTVS